MGFFASWPDSTANFGKYAGGKYPGHAYGSFPQTVSTGLGQPGVGVLGFSTYVDVRSMVRLVDKVTMNFRGGAFNTAMARANLEAAKIIAQGMADELDRRIAANPMQRPQRPGERLKNSILHYNNYQVTVGGFTVGRPTWLDRSPAEAYWRQIEYGNEARPGNVLFTNDGEKWVAPWSPGGGKNKKTPDGYPHMRLTSRSTKGVPTMIGPFPAYHFSKGGSLAARRIDFRALYRRHLAAAGISSQGVFKRTGVTVH